MSKVLTFILLAEEFISSADRMKQSIVLILAQQKVAAPLIDISEEARDKITSFDMSATNSADLHKGFFFFF